MPDRDLPNIHLNRLRQWRNAARRDDSMAFLKKQFKQEIERPHKQVSAITEAWTALVPANLAAHCRLDSLRRGVLRVGVDSSEHLYELDRLLREGLSQRLIQRHASAGLRRIHLYLDGTAE